MRHTDRMCREFAELVSFDSVSFRERRTADWLKKTLEELGFRVSEDEAGKALNGNAGNVYGFLPGTLPGTPILFSAHMDVVAPGCGKQAVFHEDGRITSAGDTVLGADDITGILEILEGIRSILEEGTPHRAIEVLFPVGEEAYIRGSALFDYGKIRAREAYVLDMSGKPGMAALKAPSILSFRVTMRGRAAHAGFEPEKGIHALNLMCRAAAGLPQGHLTENTTRNIGTIQGGIATNIIPEICVCTGEIRSWKHEEALQAMEEVKERFTRVARDGGAELTVETEVHMKAYEIPLDSLPVRHFLNACRALSLAGTLTATFGGSDNNSFAAHGIPGIVLSCGMYNAHSVNEYTSKEDLETGAALVRELIRIAGEETDPETERQEKR